ncbi:crooked neck-like protein 1 [Histomonas meleagridis]|uniref:crooked neck-like protein 1 n=1 Tax=Histomonas meleagridis TaxID=135588 RepID=UPI003559D409|nr:crooked neck-like protein 1 [Histomonas meleagridis]KAH0801842.1 crooked neck-like protein 1 [Histomonas meleagridis]
MLEPIRIHNKSAAQIQITADQLLIESVSRMKDRPRLPEIPNQTQAEIEDQRFKRRQNWELNVRRNLCSYHTYIRYARWEEDLNELDKARSVYERGIEFTNFKEPNIWKCYINMELRHKQINYARNLLERVVTILPRHDQFWLEYARLEEELGNIEGARNIFRRWIAWEPPSQAYLSFIQFEVRVKEYRNARAVFERMLIAHPFSDSYLRYADFEIKLRQFSRARRVFERGLESMGEDNLNEQLIIKFAEFEEGQGEIERARALYKYALSKLPEASARELYPAYLLFEKRFGGQHQIEDAVIEKKRAHYQELLKANPLDYDAWFELCQLLQDLADIETTRENYQTAVSHPPPLKKEKQQWSKYVLLCINFAIFEEKIAKNPENARNVYHNIISLVPHKKFTFSRLWILYAYFEIRQKNIQTARLALGHAIGTCPRPAIFDAYIEIEIMMGEKENVRKLFKQYIATIPSDIRAWVKYASFENNNHNVEEARKIFEDAIESRAVDAVEMLWSYYIEFESNVGSLDNVRQLYQRSLEASNKLSLWKGWIMLEAEVADDLDRARELFDEAEKTLADRREDRRKLRDFRVAFEEQFGNDETIERARAMVPKEEEDGTYVFPEENMDSLARLMEAAEQWSIDNH